MAQPYIVDFGVRFDRAKLTEAAQAIAAFPVRRKVQWRLENLEEVPWFDLLFVAGIIRQLNPIAKAKIEKSMIVLPGPNWQYAVDTLFGMAPPKAPYQVYSERLPEEQEEGGVSADAQPRSAPRPRGGGGAF